MNKAFIGGAGVTSAGMFNSNMLFVELQRAVISRAAETYLLLDSSKLGQTSLMQVCGLQDISALVTVGPVPEELAKAAASVNCRIEDCTPYMDED